MTETEIKGEIEIIKRKVKPIFEPNKLYKLMLNSDYEELEYSIQEAIEFYLFLDGLSKDELLLFAPRQFQWQWKTVEGTLPTRIAKYLYKNHNYKLSSATLTAIGNLVRPELGKSIEYYVDFSRDLHWEAGEFGDKGSCLWGGRNEIRRTMEKDIRFYAMRLFRRISQPKGIEMPDSIGERKVFHKEDDAAYVGVSRAWLGVGTVPAHSESKKKDTTVYLIFNGYGYKQDFFAKLFSNIFNLDYHKVALFNNGRTSGGLFINSGAYIAGPKSSIEGIAMYDFYLPYGKEQETLGEKIRRPGAYRLPTDEEIKKSGVQHDTIFTVRRRLGRRYEDLEPFPTRHAYSANYQDYLFIN